MVEQYIEVFYEKGRTDMGRKMLRCKECSKVYKAKHANDLQSHIESKHLTGLKYACQYCNKLFQTTKMLKIHTRACKHTLAPIHASLHRIFPCG